MLVLHEISLETISICREEQCTFQIRAFSQTQHLSIRIMQAIKEVHFT